MLIGDLTSNKSKDLSERKGLNMKWVRLTSEGIIIFKAALMIAVNASFVSEVFEFFEKFQ